MTKGDLLNEEWFKLNFNLNFLVVKPENVTKTTNALPGLLLFYFDRYGSTITWIFSNQVYFLDMCKPPLIISGQIILLAISLISLDKSQAELSGRMVMYIPAK